VQNFDIGEFGLFEENAGEPSPMLFKKHEFTMFQKPDCIVIIHIQDYLSAHKMYLKNWGNPNRVTAKKSKSVMERRWTT